MSLRWKELIVSYETAKVTEYYLYYQKGIWYFSRCDYYCKNIAERNFVSLLSCVSCLVFILELGGYITIETIRKNMSRRLLYCIYIVEYCILYY